MEHDSGATYTTNFRSAGNQMPVDNGEGMVSTHNTFFGDDITAPEDDLAPLFQVFLSSFRIDNEYIYSTMLRDNLKAKLQFIEVNVEHMQKFSERLAQGVQLSPTRSMHRLEAGAVMLADHLKLFDSFDRKAIQVQLFWPVAPITIRQLAHEEVARLVCINGIVIKAGASHARCIRAVIQCTSCRSKTSIPGGKASVDLPPQCIESANNPSRVKKCRPNSYVLIPTECEFEDQQVLKLQEASDDVPTGELPRHTTVVVDRYLVDRATPGSRVQIVGIVSVQERKGTDTAGKNQSRALRATVGLRAQYLRGVGVMLTSARGGDGCNVTSINQNFSSRVRSRATSAWQAEDEVLFKRFAQETPVYQIMSDSIDPAVFGLRDQKKAIACLLFSGTRKKVDSNFLRGDMNVLFIGDPSTAKSQLLKFTEKIAPIGIYTSGKGSSAAGLTASVVGSGGNFWLEAGSMVLADGGVVCIDEFDKMREQDQVAIHEAMEQQTISIAKANLTTMLNSRTSVLAAANPNLGSYDPLRSNEEQMDFAGSILSRFDLIFKVLDPKDPDIDRRLAKHVVSLHKTSGPAYHSRVSAVQQRQRTGATADISAFPLSFLTKYIAYARATCFPFISEEAKSTLLDFFVQVRKESHALTMQTMSSSSKGQAPIIQITARQLESLVRITESLAKMRLAPLASGQDAEEAIRLFKTATVDAINSGVAESQLTEAQGEIVQRIEDAIRHRVAVGSTVLQSRLAAELTRLGFEARLLDRALYAMMKREEIEWRNQRTMIHRVR